MLHHFGWSVSTRDMWCVTQAVEAPPCHPPRCGTRHCHYRVIMTLHCPLQGVIMTALSAIIYTAPIRTNEQIPISIHTSESGKENVNKWASVPVLALRHDWSQGRLNMRLCFRASNELSQRLKVYYHREGSSLLGPCLGWKRLLTLSHFILDTLNSLLPRIDSR